MRYAGEPANVPGAFVSFGPAATNPVAGDTSDAHEPFLRSLRTA